MCVLCHDYRITSSLVIATLNSRYFHVVPHGPQHEMRVLATPIAAMNERLSTVRSQLQGIKVFRSEMHGVRVTVVPFAMHARMSDGVTQRAAPVHRWCYSAMIENLSDDEVRVLGHSWHTSHLNPTSLTPHDSVDGRVVCAVPSG